MEIDGYDGIDFRAVGVLEDRFIDVSHKTQYNGREVNYNNLKIY